MVPSGSAQTARRDPAHSTLKSGFPKIQSVRLQRPEVAAGSAKGIVVRFAQEVSRETKPANARSPCRLFGSNHLPTENWRTVTVGDIAVWGKQSKWLAPEK